MKKIVLTALVCVMAMVANAQNYYVGGSLGFWNNDDADASTYTLNPEIGYNINSDWAVGAQLAYAHAKTDGAKADAYGIAPYARYTFLHAGKVNLFVDGAIEYVKAENDNWDGSIFSIGLHPGFSINLTDNFSLVSRIGFLGYNDVDDEVSNVASTMGYSHGYGLNLSGANISFGFYYNF